LSHESTGKEENLTKKRWVLKADDPKTLEDIDAVTKASLGEVANNGDRAAV
jgi:hypothetical protein